MRIHFVGYLTSPFIKKDLDLLKDLHDVSVFDLSKHATSFNQIPQYLIDTLMEWRNVMRTDVVWIWFADYPAIPFILWSKLFRKKIVVNIGGFEVYPYGKDIGYGNQLSTIRGAASRWILRRADRIITQSHAYAYLTELVCPPAQVTIIPPSIDTRLCDDALPIKKDQTVTAYCSRQSYTLKGIPTYIKASMALPYDFTVMEAAPHHDLIAELKRSKVYCQLSYTEQCNNTVIEAMACGCVPVVTDRDGLPEEIGTTGLTVPFGDAETTRNAIKVAMKMDGGPCRERARMFTEERKRKAVISLLENLWC
jgi:glycosyltransferase involved in cell wall biosynthesis